MANRHINTVQKYCLFTARDEFTALVLSQAGWLVGQTEELKEEHETRAAVTFTMANTINKRKIPRQELAGSPHYEQYSSQGEQMEYEKAHGTT